MRGKRAEREPRQLKFNFEKKVEAEDEKIRKLAESLWGQAKDLEEHTDLSTQENHTLRFSYHVGELLATKTKQYRQVIHRMFELGYLVLKEKEPECYYIFKDPKLGLRLKDQIEGI